MADYGHKVTDEMLAEMEKKVARTYEQALADMQKKLNDFLNKYQAADKKKSELVAAGKLSQRDYIAWRQQSIMLARNYGDMIKVLAQDCTNASKIAAKIINGELPSIYALNANFTAFEVEELFKINLSWSLYSRETVERLLRDNPDILPIKPEIDVPEDLRWNHDHIRQEITQGILQGEPIPKIAKRLKSVADMSASAAIRNARTATTAAECAGRMDVYKKATDMGIKIKQRWVATLDGRTRHAHRLLDGQTVDIGKPFSVDGYEIEYPGDPKAPGYLIYNCRCTVVSVDKFHDDTAERASKLGESSYQEWKAGKEIEESKKWGTYTPNAQDYVAKSAKSGIIKDDTILEPVETEEPVYKKLLEDTKAAGVSYNPVKSRGKSFAEQEIIDAISGGDETSGSCASVGLAYVGQKQGWNVLDFRGGESRRFFARLDNLYSLSKAEGISALHFGDVAGKSSCTLAKNFLKQCETGKEYYLCAGQHAAIVRKTEDGVLQYLELQSHIYNGWKDFDANPRYTLTERFGCSSASENGERLNFMINITDSKFDTKEFRSLLGYINTAEGEQRKGEHGTIK